ncbi:MAG: hypothetical protein WC516_03730 [Patescibacteria group bacterium]
MANLSIKKIIFSIIILVLIIILAWFLILVAGFLAVRWGLTNVSGQVDKNSAAYQDVSVIIPEEPATSSETTTVPNSLPLSSPIYLKYQNVALCQIKAVSQISDTNARKIFDAYKQTSSTELLARMILAVKLKINNQDQFQSQINACQLPEEISPADLEQQLSQPKQTDIFDWENDAPWQTIKKAIVKDKDKFEQISRLTGVEPRLLVSITIVEQLRLYYTQRELFEKIFKPLEILATANKMAWGVMSIKEKAAIEIENNLKNKKSDFYPGSAYERLLDFSRADVTRERYDRLTNEKDHYYSYLYGALLVKELVAQWSKAGYEIGDRPEILATLFNIGFKYSKPNIHPQVGGSTIKIKGQGYTFGSLAYEFYYSGELLKEFPYLRLKMSQHNPF